MAEFEVRGINQMQAKLRQLAKQSLDEARKALFESSEYVLGEARKQVPHETGTLERSGRASVDADSLQAVVSFDTPYAVAQHENLTAHHDQGRNAKYLERPMHSEQEAVSRIIESHLSKPFKGN